MTQSETQEARESGLFLYQTTISLWDNLLDLIFPPRCQHCGRVDTHFCDTCLDEMSQLPNHDVAYDGLPSLTAMVTTGIHDGVLQSCVQALKYQGQQHLREPLAKRLASAIVEQDWTIDIILPVPIYMKRLQERGYNQAKEISFSLAQQLNISHHDDVLVRQSQTRSQVGLTRQERIDNVREDFVVSEPTLIQGSTVLLVDDVRTTGATLSACATMLLKAGATQVYGATVTAAERSNY